MSDIDALGSLEISLLTFKFEELSPETPDATAHKPQVLVLGQPDGAVEATVYFMLNRGLAITGGHVTHGMGKTKLWIKTHSPSGAVTASVSFRKVRFRFKDSQGSSKAFEFAGEWPPR